MTVRVDWETGWVIQKVPALVMMKSTLRVKKMKAQNRQHSKTVPLPDYNGRCVRHYGALLPCDDVKVTTSCWSPRNVNYPIKEPVRMKEPAVCPK